MIHHARAEAVLVDCTREWGVDVADLNRDGHLDIVTANYRALSMSLLIGVGDGTFKPAVTHARGLRSFRGKLIPHNR